MEADVKTSYPRTAPSGFRVLLILMTFALIAGCAGRAHEPPEAGLRAAEQAISSAEQIGAAEQAPLELRMAREKLSEAEDAAQARDYGRADMLAEEARITAELAAARADANKAVELNEELERSIAALRDETERGVWP
jgi:hypothetical protein